MTVNESWEELRQRVAANGQVKQKAGLFLEVTFGTSEGLLYDGEGNDRTAIVRTLVERLDQTTQQVRTLAERIAVLERLALNDEARLAAEIERLRDTDRKKD